MPRESIAKNLRDTGPISPLRGKSGEQPITKRRRNGYSDEELLGSERLDNEIESPRDEAEEYTGGIETISLSEAGRIKAMQQATELAKEFPGLIIDNNQRTIERDASMRRAINLDDERMELVSQRNKIGSLREKVGVTAKDHFDHGREIQVSRDLMNAKNRMNFYNDFPDAQSEIADMVTKLQERRERVQNNPLTVSGIDAKIAKLNRLSVLLEKAQSYEHPTDASARRKSEIQQRRHKTGQDRIRGYEIWKAQNKSKEIPVEQDVPEQKPAWETTEEQRAAWADQQRASGRRAEEGAREAAQRPYKQAMEAHASILEGLANKLADQGIIVDLPGQVENFRVPREGIGSKITGFLFGKPKTDSTRDLMERYRRSAQAYIDTESALKKL